MNDFPFTQYEGYSLSFDRYNQLHSDNIAFIEKSLASDTELKKVIISHHVPTFLNYPEQYPDFAIGKTQLMINP